MTDSSEDRWTAIVSDPDEGATNAIAEQLGPLGFDVVKESRIEDVGAAARRHGPWRLSRHPALQAALSNAFLAASGLPTLAPPAA